MARSIFYQVPSHTCTGAQYAILFCFSFLLSYSLLTLFCFVNFVFVFCLFYFIISFPLYLVILSHCSFLVNPRAVGDGRVLVFCTRRTRVPIMHLGSRFVLSYGRKVRGRFLEVVVDVSHNPRGVIGWAAVASA